MVVYSQLAPLPTQVPFLLVSKTIGQGAYACIKKARPVDAASPIFAVKFIHKAYAIKHGRLSLKQINLEITLHRHLGQHANIVQFFSAGEDVNWKWIAMELAEGGDLFDKIESDVGLSVDVAHLYFTQLINGVAFMHSKGVAHRDLKPENILLSLEGNLKIADFGLAALFNHNGVRKTCVTSCGSPPYTAPEVVGCEAGPLKQQSRPYHADRVDIWSCGVVLFVLLVGNTPWDEPQEHSYEFSEYVRTAGHPEDDELWQSLPPETLSLLRGMMKIDPQTRFSIDDIRRHPWFGRHNEHLRADGGLTNPIGLATEMFEGMKVDFGQNPLARSPRKGGHQTVVHGFSDAMEMGRLSQGPRSRMSFSQPETPVGEITFDWDRPALSQPTRDVASGYPRSSLDYRLAEEPSLSQFTPAPAVPLSRTQFARRFADILPAHALTRFFTEWNMPALLSVLATAMHLLGVPLASPSASALAGKDEVTWLKVRTKDDRGCLLAGDVIVESLGAGGDAGCQVCFVKTKGDPVEWRRFFKKVVLLCKQAVFVPND